MENKKILSWGWYQWLGGGYKERVKRVNMVEILLTMYENKKSDLLKLF
jgi:hypothetical protein